VSDVSLKGKQTPARSIGGTAALGLLYLVSDIGAVDFSLEFRGSTPFAYFMIYSFALSMAIRDSSFISNPCSELYW
jgi:hypothetical protein